MKCCSKSGIQKYVPNSHIHVQIIHGVVMFSRRYSWRSRILLPFDELWLETWRDCVTIPSFQLLVFPGKLIHGAQVSPPTGFSVTSSSLPVSDSERSTSPDSSFVGTGFTVAVSINPPRYASCSLTWELDAASDFEFLLILLPGFTEAMSIPGLVDAIGLFADEELVGTVEDRFIAVDFDDATILSSSFCSCILFTIVLGQLIKLEFLAKQVELKWLMLNNWRRLFHSSRVNLPLVKMSASWCLVSMYRIWILDSRLILSNNLSKATLWVLDTCLIVGLRPLMIILIAASLSSKTYNMALGPECVPFDGTWSTSVRSRLVCVVGICFWHVWLSVFADRFSPWLSYIFDFVVLVWWRMMYFNH